MVLCTAYWPSLPWTAALWNSERVLLEAWETYQKGSLRNRTYIAGPNGVQRLTIPLLKGKHQQTHIRDVRIAYDEPWQRLHWRAITAAYGSAPCFAHYSEELRPFYEKKFEFLFDYNEALIRWMLQKWRWNGSLEHTAEYEKSCDNDYRSVVRRLPDNLPDWFLPARYSQVFQEKTGFLPGLSALDLLMCRGREGVWILQKSFIV